MGKILFWAVVIIGVLFLTRVLASQAAKRQTTRAPKPKKSKSTETLGKPEDMVRCANCGVYLPKSDAIQQHEQYWCSAEHVKTHHKTGA